VRARSDHQHCRAARTSDLPHEGDVFIVPRIDREDEALLTIAGEPPDMSRLPPGCPFFPRCAFARPENERLRPPLVTLPDGRRRACHVPVPEILARKEAAQ
jgi:oligopeptide transport system ATP-binding protein